MDHRAAKENKIQVLNQIDLDDLWILEWRLNAVHPILLPPLTIPWEQCCFKIGEPKE